LYNEINAQSISTVLDIIFLVIIVVCVIDGYRQGFVKSLLSLIISVLAPVIAYLITSSLWNKFSDAVAPMAVDTGEFLTAFIPFTVLMIIIIIGAKILLKTAGFLNKVPVVGVLNRILGMLFGLVGAVVIIFILATLYEIFGAYTGQIESGELVATDYSKVLDFIYDTI
jgi:membrane protein required for colicin V production